ncbi:hypothetical protein ACFL56_00830 [Candidatus Margulisiibacteriota bacterium]
MKKIILAILIIALTLTTYSANAVALRALYQSANNNHTYIENTANGILSEQASDEIKDEWKKTTVHGAVGIGISHTLVNELFGSENWLLDVNLDIFSGSWNRFDEDAGYTIIPLRLVFLYRFTEMLKAGIGLGTVSGSFGEIDEVDGSGQGNTPEIVLQILYNINKTFFLIGEYSISVTNQATYDKDIYNSLLPIDLEYLLIVNPYPLLKFGIGYNII